MTVVGAGGDVGGYGHLGTVAAAVGWPVDHEFQRWTTPRGPPGPMRASIPVKPAAGHPKVYRSLTDVS